MSELYRFGPFVLDPQKRTMSRAGSPVSLTPKAFDVLAFLVQNPHRLVTKEELLSEQEQRLVWATQGVPKPDLFGAKAGGTAWKTKPSWYIVGKEDHTVHPDLERFFAKRMGATTYELESSHVAMLSQPERVLDVIRTAAKAVQGAAATA